MSLLDWITASTKGNKTAQRLIFEQFAGKMLILCRRYVKSQRDAEELMMSGFLKFFNSLPNFRYQSDAAFFQWLKKIMINECLMFLRKQTLFVVSFEPEAMETGFDSNILDKLTADEIFHMITELPPGYRTVFNLFEIEGMSHREIASLLGISEGTSKSQLSKAKGMLQKIIIQNQEEYATRKSR